MIRDFFALREMRCSLKTHHQNSSMRTSQTTHRSIEKNISNTQLSETHEPSNSGHLDIGLEHSVKNYRLR